MIKRLNQKNKIDVYIFLKDCIDRFNEMFVTVNRKRFYLRNNSDLIYKILRTQEVYAIYEDGIKGIMVIFREKGFRTYVKFLSFNNKYNRDLLKYFIWNFLGQEIYCKVKKNNPLSEILKKKIFIQIGNRDHECLLVKKAIRNLRPFVSKDDYIDYDEMYYKRIK